MNDDASRIAISGLLTPLLAAITVVLLCEVVH